MRIFELFSLAASLICVAAVPVSNNAVGNTLQSEATFNNARRLLFDVDGNQIDAYGSKINFFNGTYYLYGNSFSTTGVAFGIKSYASIDLEHWAFEGFLYDPFSENPCSAEGGCGRPHIVYSAKRGQYILWANAGELGYVIATSASPSGPFSFLAKRALIDPEFDALQPADMAVEVFGDEAYLVFSALNFADPRAGDIWPAVYQTLHVSELTEDFTNTTRVSYPVRTKEFDLIDQEAESPDMFMRNGMFYVSASNTCGYCNGSIGLLYRSESIQGPWTRQILSGYSCNGQVEGVLPLTDQSTGETTYVWHSTSVPGGPRTGWGGHIFQPLKFNDDGSVEDLDCSVDFTFDVGFTPGSGEVTSGEATLAEEATPSDAVYTPVCDTDQFDLYQTWQASKTGVLKSVSINIAKSVQQYPLLLTVFKFPSYADLLAPGFKWTKLGSTNTNSTELSFVFETTSVPITANATVQEGDLLGLAISRPPRGGQDYAPYCHLEYDIDAGETAVLYQRGAAQNSWRGLKGDRSPVYERPGKSVKFFASYV